MLKSLKVLFLLLLLVNDLPIIFCHDICYLHEQALSSIYIAKVNLTQAPAWETQKVQKERVFQAKVCNV
jgi:hypothetical protein